MKPGNFSNSFGPEDGYWIFTLIRDIVWGIRSINWIWLHRGLIEQNKKNLEELTVFGLIVCSMGYFSYLIFSNVPKMFHNLSTGNGEIFSWPLYFQTPGVIAVVILAGFLAWLGLFSLGIFGAEFIKTTIQLKNNR